MVHLRLETRSVQVSQHCENSPTESQFSETDILATEAAHFRNRSCGIVGDTSSS